MRNCRVKNGHQLMAIGSELSGGIENVFVDNCHFDRAARRGRARSTTSCS
jgi:polygalacturonase